HASPGIVADFADELHALCSQSLHVSPNVGGLEGQDRPLRRRLPFGRVESYPNAADVERTPILAFVGHPQTQQVPIERERTPHVLDFVVDILHTRNHRPTLQMREAWPRLTNIHYVGPVPAALEAISAARTVFDRSIAIVMGPTPPGTGEIAFAFRRTASKSTSPTVREPLFAVGSGMRLMPTSMTTTPSRTMSAVTNRGEPIAATRISARRVWAASSRVALCATVTVAFAPLAFCIRRAASGLPTMLLRPRITTSLRSGEFPERRRSSTTPAGVAGANRGRPMRTSPTFVG